VQKNPTTRALLAALLLLLSGCDQLDNCPDSLDPITADPEKGHTDSETLSYESAPWDGHFQRFPPNTDVHFEHGLAVQPFLVKTYLSFKSEGTNGAGNGDATENAGNQARIQCVDAERIVVENDTCEEDFFIRVVAVALPSGSPDVVCPKP
jgi:hypothetical protein